jgi:hypothetical protein
VRRMVTGIVRAQGNRQELCVRPFVPKMFALSAQAVHPAPCSPRSTLHPKVRKKSLQLMGQLQSTSQSA